ncbi:MAG: RagB/SusD family nutrient uptake outer membrane protein, partial [Tannerella sp.]|nr:RagB/SusD family nutrient uptake outer membrane protein [Tannerella sp.]
MKNKSLKIRTIILAFITLSALSNCADYLDIVPDQTPTIEDAFTDRVHAQRFLATLYSYMPRIGSIPDDPGILTSDEWVIVESAYDEANMGYYRGNRIKHGTQNVSAPHFNFWNGENNGRGVFIALRECNIFLENIHLVGPDLYENERAQWIAEAKFFKAYYHFYLMRLYGPIPLIKENLPPSASVDLVKIYREPVDDVIDYICQLCDEAIPDLPLSITNIATEYGRITRPIAATLKAQALVWGASPLFNGNSEYNTVVDNRGIHLFSATEDPTKWTKAAQAAKAAIDICNEAGINHLFVFNDARFVLSDTTRRLQSLRGAATIKWNDELIWGNPVNTTEALQSHTLPVLKAEDRLGTGPSSDLAPSLTVAEQFYSNNGVPINEDKYYNYSARFDTTTVGDDHYYYIPKGIVTAKLNTYREPRFYANLGFDGGYWYGNGRIKDVGMGTDAETPHIIKMKGGEVSGQNSNIRYSITGYFAKKGTNFETACSSTGAITRTRFTFPIMRLADLYLMYAEALNE